MGSPTGIGFDGEHPQHSVTLSDFYISNTEIRWGLWDTVYQWGITNGYTDLSAGQKVNVNEDTQHPVTNVNWFDVIKWCNARSQKEGLTPVYYTSTTFSEAHIFKIGTTNIENTMVNWYANGYRLPTEAEWEYAAQGGSKRHNPPHIYSGSDSLDDVAWYSKNSNNNSHPVGTKSANELGLYDMSGNVMEFCWDWEERYGTSPQTNPQGATKGSSRIIRDGSFRYGESSCRIASRYSNSTYFLLDNLGFRVSRTK